MTPIVLDPARYTDFLAEGLCPICGRKRLAQEKHSQNQSVNDMPTWGCVVSDDNPVVRKGML